VPSRIQPRHDSSAPLGVHAANPSRAANTHRRRLAAEEPVLSVLDQRQICNDHQREHDKERSRQRLEPEISGDRRERQRGAEGDGPVRQTGAVGPIER
jgi:hypothetical protein